MACSELTPRATRHLRLLKRVLTQTLFVPDPDADNENQLVYVAEMYEHHVLGQAVTLLPMARLDSLQDCAVAVVRDQVPGDFIETGVWRGGATILMRAILDELDVHDRLVWVADSFEGLPEPDAELHPIEAKFHSGPVAGKWFDHLAVDLESVQANFELFDFLDDQVCFLKGWFKDTLPAAPIERLALMRLDGDYYESTRDALVNLYDKLSPGGFVIIDDYGDITWTECKRAVDEFRHERRITAPMTMVDTKCGWWRKP
jgi:O-methyltransferase